MGFLDNLESNLKSLESVTEREDPAGAKNRRESERANRLALQPFVEKLRKSTFTDHLLRAAHQESFRIRARISVVWVGDILRLELPGNRLELRPSRQGVMAVASHEGHVSDPVLVNFEGDPKHLLQSWLAKVSSRKPTNEVT
jgi:hypothetical protein